MSKSGLIRGRVSFGANEEYRALLDGGGESAALPVDAVRSIAGGADVVAMSASRCVEPLRPWLQQGVTAALLGSSGAGKSTIANALTGRTLATQEVREHDSRRRHTTTGRMLMALPGGAWLIDNPGMRELGLLASEASLDLGFPETAALAEQCRFADCRHEQEPACAVRQALAESRISQRCVPYETMDLLSRVPIRSGFRFKTQKFII